MKKIFIRTLLCWFITEYAQCPIQEALCFLKSLVFSWQQKPKCVVLENVKGLLNHDGGRTFATIYRVLIEIGHTVECQFLNTKWFLPQNRERILSELKQLHSYGVKHNNAKSAKKPLTKAWWNKQDELKNLN